MNRLFKLQFLGPLALFAATLCAELAARALQYFPSSELLWFINLRMFGLFQRSHALLSEIVPIDGFQFFGLALPIFLLACLGLAAKRRLSFTIATHLSAVYAGFLVLSWQVGVPTITQASLVPVAVPSGPGLYVMATILGTCLLSFAITHLLYFYAVLEEIGALLCILLKTAQRLRGSSAAQTDSTASAMVESPIGTSSRA
ncbi:hypothetical protein [Bradyrhizobium sp. Ash2021]|uniref:hypothetical protein n=1 Tax=Bradyrhizobium sp. Ash2021 TaxID=2954771 RepID=UPI002816825B|nr:hypothetical protein [Bradyrhizobium sp. Ash2021]WMT78224.1 hypothetical protein NL528_18590 [Bradyrhizobium sp. Ash2021]